MPALYLDVSCVGNPVCREWIEAHQQAAEEDLMMPVVLEEFGSKLDARYLCSPPASHHLSVDPRYK